MIFHTLHHQVDSQALTIQEQGAPPLNIRPKTCQLLVILLQHAGQVVSKETLLQRVWAGTVVSEQVVFQSINELRQLFPDKDVIKTIPKQGYMWLPKVEISTEEKLEKTTKTGFFRSMLQVDKVVFISASLLLFIALVVIVSPVLTPQTTNALVQADEGQSPFNQAVKGSVLILPTTNKIRGNDHAWVKFGMMDQVIQRMPSSSEYGVLQTDYVMSVLKRADVFFESLNKQDIESIFVVSGAELIVTSVLSGAPYDYQLTYRLYTRNAMSQGVLFDSEIQHLIDQFSHLVAEHLGDKARSDIAYQADFNNQLLGRAIEFRLQRKFTEALPLLQSLVKSEPDNLTARRLLVSTLFSLKREQEAKLQLQGAIALGEQQGDTTELTRLLLDQGYYLKRSGKAEQAHVVADRVVALSQQNNDWLYLAYGKSLLAGLAIEQQDYLQAENLYHQAKSHHQVLRCPVGESITWVQLAQLAKRQNNLAQFNQALANAKTIARNRELERQLNWIQDLEVEQEQGN